MSFEWVTQSEEQALASMPEDNMKDGRYWGIVTRQEVIPGKVRDDGTVGNSWLKLNILFETPPGKIFGEASIFNGEGKMFFKRKHFWESAGKIEMLNSPPEDYLGKRVQADVIVESYFSNKYQETKKKYVVVDFVGESKKTKSESESNFEDDAIPF